MSTVVEHNHNMQLPFGCAGNTKQGHESSAFDQNKRRIEQRKPATGSKELTKTRLTTKLDLQTSRLVDREVIARTNEDVNTRSTYVNKLQPRREGFPV